jgi:hypothetical protein
MVNDNFKDIAINWTLFGLLFFSLLSFAVLFSFNNNPDALGNTKNEFNKARQITGTRLIQLEDSSNVLLNITSKTNPELGDLGSRDSVATSYGEAGTIKGFFEASKVFMGFILFGTAGEILISVFAGMMGLTLLYLTIKAVRNGL